MVCMRTRRVFASSFLIPQVFLVDAPFVLVPPRVLFLELLLIAQFVAVSKGERVFRWNVPHPCQVVLLAGRIVARRFFVPKRDKKVPKHELEAFNFLTRSQGTRRREERWIGSDRIGQEDEFEASRRCVAS